MKLISVRGNLFYVKILNLSILHLIEEKVSLYFEISILVLFKKKKKLGLIFK